jgi:CDP-2,3-bis-(O-geranylgeranyl)-sn-glycerol synthase
MVGDLLSSFLKRRLGIASSDSALGLDQGLEALVPVLAMQAQGALRFSEAFVIMGAFFVLDVGLSRLLYTLHMRKRPL